MQGNNLIFLENLEWLDTDSHEMVHRVPSGGSGEIKWGAQLTVRESQVAVFFYKGKAVEAFGPGRHTLKTGNIPLLTKIASLPWAMNSPLRAEVYFVNMKVFTNLKWGTRDPVAFKDAELGLIRLRAFGVFNVRVVQPVLFINSLVGTQGVFTTEAVEEYLNLVVVSRFNDFMGEQIDSILNLPSKYDEFSAALTGRLQEDFARFGLGMSELYINSITPPAEVQKAIDDRSRMGLFKDMDKLMQMKAAMAMEKATEQETSGQGMGAGLGLMMPAMLARYFNGKGEGGSSSTPRQEAAAHCAECGHGIPVEAKFCPFCGHQQLVFQKCAGCGKNLSPGARFCSRCGQSVDQGPREQICPGCGTRGLPDALFCNQCGEKLQGA